MPVRKCSNGKYRIGKGKCMYTSRASAERAYRGYLASEYGESHHITKGINLAEQYHCTKPIQKTKKR